ncbi:MAG: hypothetical protein CVU57_23420 [Deltaproteobacteria bacterium HGW-Deltaproteobacteria-15]|jgi:hypothetical protein|nr:MAG: hypothetical protein CVU57_23420 [Deltaproteobacteria bacterium HGW-Deltaproteobacteria-15]
MRLYPIHAMGIQAYCSALIVDPDDSETVYFMSIAGYQVTVKGIIANLLENYGISVEIDGSTHYLTRASLGYKIQMRKLPSGLVHAVLFPKIALPKNDEENQNRFFVLAQEGDGLLSLFFRHLDEKTEIPLHPSWDRWLWKNFEEQEGWTLELQTLVGSYQGYLFEFNHKRLHDLVSDAIRSRTPEVIGCMEWKGANGNGELDFSKRVSG